MTPLAARMFRDTSEENQRLLASSQFFECSQIVDLAQEMRLADQEVTLAHGQEVVFSEKAQLPAPRTILESMVFNQRLMFACEMQDDGFLVANCFGEVEGHAELLWTAGFIPGTRRYRIISKGDLDPEAKRGIIAGQVLIEALLCMINQPGLLDHRERSTDKRIIRKAAQANIGKVPPKWHECRIRPGVHSAGSSATDSPAERQLHYVRKHFKPSLDRWVDGYWRGNADLGIYLKWYSIKSPPKTTDAGARPTS